MPQFRRYKTVTCPDCQKSRIIRKDSTSSYCQSCRGKRPRSLFPVESIDYKAAHKWVDVHKNKKYKCTICHRQRGTHWCYLGEGATRDLNNYVEMCVPCHHRFDRHRVGVIL